MGAGDFWNYGGGLAKIVKFDSSGRFLWEKDYNGNIMAGITGTPIKIISIPDEPHNFLMLAHIGSMPVIIKTDSSGTTLWQKIFVYNGWQALRDFILLPDKSIISCGQRPDAGTLDFLINRIDSSGSLIWEQSLHNPKSQGFYSIIDLFDGSFMLSGKDDSMVYLLQIDQWGNSLWDTLFYPMAGRANISSLYLGMDSSFYLGVHTHTTYTQGIGDESFGDFYKIKDRTIQWVKQRSPYPYNMVLNTMGQLIVLDADFMLDVAGLEFLNDSTTFNHLWWPPGGKSKWALDISFVTPGKLLVGGLKEMTGLSNKGVYWISMVSGVGDPWIPDPDILFPTSPGFRWSYNFPLLTLTDTSFSGLSHNDSIYSREWSTSFGTSSNQKEIQVKWDTTLSTTIEIALIIENFNKSKDTLFVTLSKGINGISHFVEDEIEMDLYPNPIESHLNIELVSKSKRSIIGEITITDLNGSKVLFQTLNSPKEKLDLSSLPPGVFIARIEVNGVVVRRKVVKK
jgi:Secretion system C-terminal sorting domain